MALQPCIRCQHWPDEKDVYCTRCGAPLQNKCTNNGGPLGDPCTNINNHQAIHCAKCGSPTFFNKAGLLPNNHYLNSPKIVQNEMDELVNLNLFTHKFFKQ